jgi:predicted GNAT family acetyltransferase
VRETLDLIRGRGERIVPVCPFIVAFVARHAEYASLVQGR